MPDGSSYSSILSAWLHFILHICRLKTCVLFFKYTTVQTCEVYVLFSWVDWTCSQELLTQGKAVLHIWNTCLILQARSCQELGYHFIACWVVLAFQMFNTRRLCITSSTSRTRGYTLPVMLIHSLFISLLYTMRCDFIFLFYFFNLLK